MEEFSAKTPTLIHRFVVGIENVYDGDDRGKS
jgi:hypothetical protein